MPERTSEHENRKRARLEAAGWRLGSASDFLGLTPEESAYVDLKLALARELRRLRSDLRLTQSQVAKLVTSSQARVARMEAADSSVTIDLLVRALLAMGATPKDLARAISAAA